MAIYDNIRKMADMMAQREAGASKGNPLDPEVAKKVSGAGSTGKATESGEVVLSAPMELPSLANRGAENTAVLGNDLIGELSWAGSTSYPNFFMRPYNPAELYRRKGGYKIYDEMRDDDQIFAVLSMKKLLMFGNGWDVEFDDDSMENECKDYVEWALKDYLEGGLDARLYEVMCAMDYGFSLTEKVAGVVQEGRFAGKWAFRSLKTRPPHGILLHTDEHGNITKITQDQKGGAVPMPPEKFILYQHNEEFDNPYGRPDLNRGVYRAWFAKNQIIAFWNMYLEARAFPLVHGQYPPSFSKSDQENFLTMLKRIQARTAMITPVGTTVEAIHAESGTTQSGYENAIDHYNMMIARAILVPDLAGMSGAKTGGGSYALGLEQFKMFYSTLQKERIYIERLVNRELVKWLVEWNYGSYSDSTVRFKLKPLEEQDKASMAGAWLSAVQSNVWKPNPEEIDFYRQLCGFPEGPVDIPSPPAQAPQPIIGPDGQVLEDKDGNPMVHQPGAPFGSEKGEDESGQTEEDSPDEGNADKAEEGKAGRPFPKGAIPMGKRFPPKPPFGGGRIPGKRPFPFRGR